MSIPPYKALERLLDYTSLKQKVIGQNIANTETIGYKRQDVKFKDLLDSSLDLQMKKSSNDYTGNRRKSEFKITIFPCIGSFKISLSFFTTIKIKNNYKFIILT